MTDLVSPSRGQAEPMDENPEHPPNPAKRRRISLAGDALATHNYGQPVTVTDTAGDYELSSSTSRDTNAQNQTAQNAKLLISIPTAHLGQTIGPFLAKHIPDQYAPLGGSSQHKDSPAQSNPNTKYCYRHRPDLKCRRQVDEPSMDQLQHVSLYWR